MGQGARLYPHGQGSEVGRVGSGHLVDVYACKPFSAEAVVELTREWFDASDVVCKEF